MAAVRVYLCTYRRNHLLRRATASLLAQTFIDWVCELHNDAPDDPFPAKLADELSDPRITVVTHPTNLGPTRTFNLFFRGGVAERYVSILEDDNWWEPEFLRTMVAELDARPTVQMAWTNMRLWDELPDGSWVDTGQRVWPDEGPDGPTTFEWPDHRQICGALHSNGAMLVRTADIVELILPDETPFPVMEAARERRYRHPLLFVSDPLANFAVTRATARGNDRAIWGQCQTLLAASFFRNVRPAGDVVADVWARARAAVPPQTGPLFMAGLADGRCRYLLAYARPRDWLRFVAGVVRHPRQALRVMAAKRAHPAVWAFLDESTSETHDRAGRPTRFANAPHP